MGSSYMHFLFEWSHALLPPEGLQASLGKVKISPRSKISVCVTGNYKQLTDHATLESHNPFYWGSGEMLHLYQER